MHSWFCLIAKVGRVEEVVKLLQGDSLGVVGSAWVRNKLAAQVSCSYPVTDG